MAKYSSRNKCLTASLQILSHYLLGLGKCQLVRYLKNAGVVAIRFLERLKIHKGGKCNK
jgi:hypothetical protein